MLHVKWQDIRSIRPEIWSEIISGRTIYQFIHVGNDFLLADTPCKICIRLGKSNLSQRGHHLRPSKSLRQENHVWIVLVNFINHPTPEGYWFRVRIVNSEDCYSLFYP